MIGFIEGLLTDWTWVYVLLIAFGGVILIVKLKLMLFPDKKAVIKAFPDMGPESCKTCKSTNKGRMSVPMTVETEDGTEMEVEASICELCLNDLTVGSKVGVSKVGSRWLMNSTIGNRGTLSRRVKKNPRRIIGLLFIIALLTTVLVVAAVTDAQAIEATEIEYTAFGTDNEVETDTAVRTSNEYVQVTVDIFNPYNSTENVTVTLYHQKFHDDVVEFDVATLVDSSENHDTALELLDVESWTDDEARFLVNYARGKNIRRFIVETTLYGHTFQPGDPMPDPSTSDDNGDGIPDGFLYTERNWKLGDIIAATPVVVSQPIGTYPVTVNDNGNSFHDFDEFAEAHADTPMVMIIGSNDGMLHAFAFSGIDLNEDGDYDDADEYYPGEEIWAYVLPDAMSKLKELYYDSTEDDDYEPDGQRLSPHQYFADGPSTLAVVRARVHDGDTDNDGNSEDPEFRVMLFFGEGRGGNRYWAFDVTDPMVPKPVWSLTDTTMGVTLSRPAVGAVEVGSSPELDNDNFKYFAFMGSGYDFDQVDGSAEVGNVLYQVDINDGTIVDTFDAGDAAGGADIPNAIVGRAIMVDDDDDFFIERVYAGDLDGNIWRWDLDTDTVANILDVSPEPLTTESERLERPIIDGLTYANIFGFHVITAATGGDTRRYIGEGGYRLEYPQQYVYLVVDTDRYGVVRSLLDGMVNEEGDYEEGGDTVGVDLLEYRVAESLPVVSAFTEYDEEGKIYRGFQIFYSLYIPDEAGLRSIRCTFGSSELLILDCIFNETDIVESAQGTVVDMGEGKATGISYVGGNILFSIGDQFKVYGQGIYRFESSQQVKARLKVLRWREVY